MKLDRARSWLSAGAALLLLAGGLTLCSHRAPIFDRQLASVKRGGFDVRVDTVGVLDAARAFQVTSQVRGARGKIIQVADDGAAVNPGDVLVRFDPSPFEADIQKLGGEVRAREALLEVARQALEMEKSQVHKTLDNGEYDQRAAQQELARYRAYIDDLKRLAAKGYAIEGEVAQARRKEEELVTRLQKADTELSRLSNEAVHSIAKAASEVNKAESELATSRAALKTAQEDLASTVIHAPSSGFVVLSEIFDANVKRKPRTGDTVWQGQSLLYLPDLSAMVVKTQVREEDLNKLKAGQRATVRLEAYPDLSFEAEVSSVGALAVETPGGTSAGKHFQLTLKLHQADPRMRPGMTARVSIVAESVRDTLVVPVTALYYEGGQTICYVFDGERPVARKVVVGRRGDDLLEIASGVREGERVSLARP
jgi:HlyD family secretion protein